MQIFCVVRGFGLLVPWFLPNTAVLLVFHPERLFCFVLFSLSSSSFFSLEEENITANALACFHGV